MNPSHNKPHNPQSVAEFSKLAHIMIVLSTLCAGCATSADMNYNFRANEAICTTLSRELAERQHDSNYRRSLNQKYYRNCVGK